MIRIFEKREFMNCVVSIVEFKFPALFSREKSRLKKNCFTHLICIYFYTDLKYFVIHIHNSFRDNYAILICFLIEN